jgi:ABC-type bacteriocin/lantibiotic exporter with double-glycine peptidase domain
MMSRKRTLNLLLYVVIVVNILSLASSLVWKLIGNTVTFGDAIDLLLVFNGSAVPFYAVLLLLTTNAIQHRNDTDAALKPEK